MSPYDNYDEFPRYITAAERQANAQAQIKKLKRQGHTPQPIEAFRSQKIANSFWGHAWCRHLEKYSDYESRLPRGRSYARSGSICHLGIKPGKIHAYVSGSELYEIHINITPLSPSKWKTLKKKCSGKIGALIDLLQGKLSDEVMSIVTDPADGLFPSPNEIRLSCDCPDHADLCKHLAATLYGIGVRLDDQPELLFTLRDVDHSELIQPDLKDTLKPTEKTTDRRIASTDLANIFGVDIAENSNEETDPPAPPIPQLPSKKIPKKRAKKRPTKTVSKKPRPTPSPKTGSDIRKLRRKCGMSEYEFGLILDLSAVTIAKWESRGKAPHRASKPNQQKLDTLAPLTKAAAQKRLNEYR